MNSSSFLVRIAAVCLALLTISTAAAGWVIISGLERLGSSSVTSTETFETLGRTLDVTAETTGTVRDALGDLDRLTLLVASSSATTATFIEGVADLTSTRIPESLRAVEDSLPALIDAGAVVDDTLTTLSLFGVDYQPTVPFDEALQQVQTSLEGLPDDIAQQGAELRSLVPEVETVGETSAALAGRIADTRDRLAEAEVLLDEYRVILTETESAVGLAAGPLRLAPLARALLIVVGVSGVILSVVVWRMANRTVVSTVAPNDLLV